MVSSQSQKVARGTVYHGDTKTVGVCKGNAHKKRESERERKKERKEGGRDVIQKRVWIATVGWGRGTAQKKDATQ